MRERASRAIQILAGILGLTLSLGSAHATLMSTDPPLNPEDGQITWRWIHVGQPCPTLPPAWTNDHGWIERDLFPQAASLGCPALQEFCLYEKTSGQVTSAEIVYLQGLGGPQPDIMGLYSSSGSRNLKRSEVLSQGDIMQLEQRFYEQVGKLSSLPNHENESYAPEVRLTIVDTSPDTAAPSCQIFAGAGNGGPQSSPHGEALGLFAHELLCETPFTGCKVDIRTRLAMPFLSVDARSKSDSLRDDILGGYVGLIGELAEVMIDELEDWDCAMPTTRDRLVLNLSLAWDGIYGGPQSQVSKMPAPVQAVYRALECLASRGSIVVASAGNFSDAHPANLSGVPLYPAAWTKRQTSTGEPLLYAAGGVDVKRRPLANSLADGMPEFLVYSDHAVTTDPGDHILTGSSVSALGLSAMAAAVAYYAPDLGRQAILETVFTSGEPTPLVADFCRSSYGGSCPAGRYASLCESVREACSNSHGECSQTPACNARPSNFLNLSATNPQSPFDVTGFSTNNPTGCQNDPEVDRYTSTPCPQEQRHGLPRKPGTHPQPQADKCPTCTYVKGSGTFHGEITGLASSESVQNLTLTLSSCAGVAPPTVAYQPTITVSINSNNKISMTNLPACNSAALSYTLSVNSSPMGSVTSPILVGQ